MVREYRERWQAVADIEAEEQRSASVELRWQQLNAIIGLAVGLGIPLTNPEDEADEQAVWERWATLKRKQEQCCDT